MPLKPALHIRPKSVLLATDFSFESERALRHAVALVRHYGAKLHLAHVVSSVGIKLAGPEAVAIADEVACRDLRALEEKLVSQGFLAGIEHDSLVRKGEVWPEIERLIDEEEADMVVIGTHGRRGLGRLLLGSVAEEIIRHAECPVLTVGPDFTTSGVENTHRPRPILLATDFQPASSHAIPYAATFARERGVPLILLHVIPLIPHSPLGEWQRGESLQERRRKTEAVAMGRLKGLTEEFSLTSSTVECLVRCGDVAEEILKVAGELRTDAIAMGLHRSDHVRAVSHFRSTIAYDVICRAHCAVLTVRD